MASRPRFLLTFLAWAGGLSGGDRHLLEVAAHWREHVDLAVLAPPQGLPTFRAFLGDVPAYELWSTGARRASAGGRCGAKATSGWAWHCSVASQVLYWPRPPPPSKPSWHAGSARSAPQ